MDSTSVVGSSTICPTLLIACVGLVEVTHEVRIACIGPAQCNGRRRRLHDGCPRKPHGAISGSGHDIHAWQSVPDAERVHATTYRDDVPQGADAPSPRYMRKQATWSGRVREVAVPLVRCARKRLA